MEEPVPVRELRTYIKEADGVLICTPEYQNGVTDVLKNALDWLVSSGEIINKPMGGDKANASLLLTLKMMNAEIVERGTLIIPHITLKLNIEGIITDPELKQELLSVLQTLEQACH